MDNVDREFRTSRRALNVLSVRAGLPEQATKAPGVPASRMYGFSRCGRSA